MPLAPRGRELGEQLHVLHLRARLGAEAEQQLRRQGRVHLRPPRQQAPVVVALELARVRGEGSEDLLEPVAVEARGERRLRERAPDAPRPPAGHRRLGRSTPRRPLADELVSGWRSSGLGEITSCGSRTSIWVRTSLASSSAACGSASVLEIETAGTGTTSSNPASSHAHSSSRTRTSRSAGRPRLQATLTIWEPASRSAINVAGAPSSSSSGWGAKCRTVADGVAARAHAAASATARRLAALTASVSVCRSYRP